MERLHDDMELVWGHTLPNFGLWEVDGKKTVCYPLYGWSYGNKLSHTYAIAMQHFLDLPYLWELHGIWIRYYSVDYPY